MLGVRVSVQADFVRKSTYDVQGEKAKGGRAIAVCIARDRHANTARRLLTSSSLLAYFAIRSFSRSYFLLLVCFVGKRKMVLLGLCSGNEKDRRPIIGNTTMKASNITHPGYLLI